MFKPKYTCIFIFTDRVFFFFFFFSAVASGTLYLYSRFSVNALTGVEILLLPLWPLAWQAKPRQKNRTVTLQDTTFTLNEPQREKTYLLT